MLALSLLHLGLYIAAGIHQPLSFLCILFYDIHLLKYRQITVFDDFKSDIIGLNHIYLMFCIPIWIYGLCNNRLIMGYNTRYIIYGHYLFSLVQLIMYPITQHNYNSANKWYIINFITSGILIYTSHRMYGTMTPYRIDIMDFMMLLITLTTPMLIYESFRLN